MKSELEDFTSGLDNLLEETKTRVEAEDRLGYATDDESMRLLALARSVQYRRACMRELIAVIAESEPTPLSEQRRLMLEQGIIDGLPRILSKAAA